MGHKLVFFVTKVQATTEGAVNPLFLLRAAVDQLQSRGPQGEEKGLLASLNPAPIGFQAEVMHISANHTAGS